MNTKNNIIIAVKILISTLLSKLDPDSKFHIILVILFISLILGSSILADILLEQLLQADGVIRLSPPKEVI